jgi:hypothetical protein
MNFRRFTMKRNWGKAIIAGLVATLVMTAVGLWVAPMMGMPPMNPAEMLAGAMGGSILLGWIGHLMIGVILAIGYAIVAPSLPGPGWLRRAVRHCAVAARPGRRYPHDGDAGVLRIGGHGHG